MILIYDSGLGGTSSIDNLRKKYPLHHFVYFGDRENAPYGNKNPEVLRELFEENLHKFSDQKIEDIVLQCNTLCSVLPFDNYPVRVHDIIEKTLEKCKNFPLDTSFLVVGTSLTIQKGRYQNGLRNLGFVNVNAIALPQLAGMIENFASESEIRLYLEEKIGHQSYDVVILGCTHFPFYQSIFKELCGGICLDSTNLEYEFISPPQKNGNLLLAMEKDDKLLRFLNKHIHSTYEWYELLSCANK